MNRIDALRRSAFKEVGFNGYLIFNKANLIYFVGIQSCVALLVPFDGESTIFVYGVNYEQTKAEANSLKVELARDEKNLMEKIAAEIKVKKISNLAVDVAEAEFWLKLNRELYWVNSIKTNNVLIQKLRAIKDKQEIALMRKAAELTIQGMKAAYEAVTSGVKEHEVAAEVEYAMRRRGSGGVAFESIVVSGVSSAFPHGSCFDREIREGDLVIVDIGATYKHYCSDMTRTLVAGKPTEKQRRIYDVVKSSQFSALEKMKASVSAWEVDFSARNLIESAGYGNFFVHRLGHGVGLEIHEQPVLSQDNKDLLVAGNVVTVEPGIYIPDFGGVRIEDTVLVQENGAEKLTYGLYNLEK